MVDLGQLLDQTMAGILAQNPDKKYCDLHNV